MNICDMGIHPDSRPQTVCMFHASRWLESLEPQMNRNPLLNFAAVGYRGIIIVATWLQPLFLLVIRLYWGWQFFGTGKAKLENIPKFTGLFQGWGVPFPGLGVHLAGSTECFGGLLLLLGLGSRVITLPLIFTMIVAYLTASPDALKNVFSNPDGFVTADPFLFMLAAVIVFLFGPGPISLDGLIERILKARAGNEICPSAAPSS